MKQMTEKELKPHLEALGLNYDGVGDLMILGNYIEFDGDTLNLIDLGIALIPKQPEITIENLGKFMAKFGEYPEARFGPEPEDVISEGSRHCHETKLIAISQLEYISATDGECEFCKIIDPRWYEIGEG